MDSHKRDGIEGSCMNLKLLDRVMQFVASVYDMEPLDDDKNETELGQEALDLLGLLGEEFSSYPIEEVEGLADHVDRGNGLLSSSLGQTWPEKICIGMAMFGSGSHFPMGVFSSEAKFEAAVKDMPENFKPRSSFVIHAKLDQNLEKERIERNA